MPSTYHLSLLTSLFAAAVAKDPFYMCTESKCEECPSAVGFNGEDTDYPNCVIYNSEDVFANQGYEGTDGGGYKVFFDIQTQDSGCAVMIKSPASTDVIGCGVVVANFKQAACAMVPLETSFMLQTCCGDDCTDAGGSKMIRGMGPMGLSSVSMDKRGGIYLKDANGTVIEPADVGPPPELQTKRQVLAESVKAIEAPSHLARRGCSNSWKSSETYTRPASNVQIMLTSVCGGEQKVSTTRTQTWSTSMELGIADILSIGVSTSFEQSISNSEEVTVTVPEGQCGKLGFTATLQCSKGTGTCDTGDVEGEVCWPSKAPNGDVDGTYRVIVES
ncbi:hypothetical protein K491DRAFT_596474 [Lophiostoma macrostomum CBS 122681]|uniref:Uncharacterized protein n=1 Tax=Lophiostoma macrostomum CBS 122681 TaxID=1314788 RepID=A0A6A6TAC4_9PLEO|nr:hypothetical protein K491DRAFT_596474 [Lophiostoma macrostomum CBS 122681]